MLHFDISDRKKKLIEAKYRALYEGGDDIAGESIFKRVFIGN
jgi:hypothetical protein